MFWKSASLPLTTYLGLLTQPLDASSVAALLMPAALQLRDMHNSGLVFQNLCPACDYKNSRSYTLTRQC